MSKAAPATGALRSALKFRRTYSLTNLRHRGWVDGVLGGDRRWMAVGAFASMVWAVQWAWRREPEVVYRTKLKPGESLTIVTAKPVPKKEKRAR